jgi:hypothetical protein
MDIGYETDNNYKNWTFSDEYGEMAVAYYIQELRKEEINSNK